MISLTSLTQSAMLGTETGFKPPTVNHLHISDSDLEAALLASAAFVGTAEVGGMVPLRLDEGVEASPGETRTQIPERAVQLLKRTLEDEDKLILRGFLEQVAARELLVSPEVLPALLGLWKKDLGELIVQVAGERGQWIARQNPAWAYALERHPLDAWEHGQRTERVSALEQVRAVDSGKARTWLLSTWDKDAPEDRATFLRTLGIGLSMDDEPFLETCLDDKRKEVREVARGLLMHLDQSRFSQRMWERVKPYFRLKSKILGGDKLEAQLPDTPDAAAKRDGVGSLQLRKRMGEKADLLAQMIALVPPVFWNREFSRTPEKLISAASSCEWKEAIILGWQVAARNAGDCDWAEAIVSFWMDDQDGKFQVLDSASQDELIKLIRVEKIEALADACIKPKLKELDDTNPLLALLEKCHRPWTEKLARMVLLSAQRQSGKRLYRLPMALPGFAYWVPVKLADKFTTGWVEEPEGYWRERIEKFLMTLKFRAEIQQSLMD